ncbi:uncharacterized protein A1O5_04114 [Cladophialophora psammophila CBS 110553]|uniref:Major facilitator superfamily (MFS) profile domain-containing protein n=1 Tax=Cladophialophora psammophila CBS 110553 TaxID=1182543 RepID=W9X6L4_9EURO|nr:uncharacterized protein A1O5_04114 [Cladophialophora psammophila CBS 110553]EXJ72965.1 hypothetical protein A1O5_04114 [Cladophialophora psammophila CBS 110553]
MRTVTGMYRAVKLDYPLHTTSKMYLSAVANKRVRSRQAGLRGSRGYPTPIKEDTFCSYLCTEQGAVVGRKAIVLIVVIPYACAAVFLIAICFLSDRYNTKGPFLIGTLSVSCIGYIILLSVRSIPVLIFATCLITAGLYPSVILLTSWLGINTCGFTKRGTTWAMAEVFGQCFSIMGTHVYDHPPRFAKGHSIVLGMLLVAIIMATSNIFWMRYQNKRKEAEVERYRSSGELHPHFERSLEDEGDQHLAFRYIL